jgi:hypothetical protein
MVFGLRTNVAVGQKCPKPEACVVGIDLAAADGQDCAIRKLEAGRVTAKHGADTELAPSERPGIDVSIFLNLPVRLVDGRYQAACLAGT